MPVSPTPDLAAQAGEPAAPPAQSALRFERGGRVYATDGPVGTLRNVVVDAAASRVTALAVRVDGFHDAVLIPPDLVERGAGSALFLAIDRETFVAGARKAVRFAPGAYLRVDPKKLLRNAATALGRWSIAAVDRAALDFRPASAPTTTAETTGDSLPVEMAAVRARLGLTERPPSALVSAGAAD